MTPTDPALLFLVPFTVLFMVGLAWPLEKTERGRRWMDRLGNWIER